MNKHVFTLICLGCLVLAGCTGEGPSPKPIAKPSTPKLKNLVYFEDGGTTGFVLEKDGTEISFCFDGRLETKTPCRIFAGATHPESEDAELVVVGSDREKELIRLLHAYLNSEYTKQKQAELLSKGSWELPKPEAHAWKLLQAIDAWERVVKKQGTTNKPDAGDA